MKSVLKEMNETKEDLLLIRLLSQLDKEDVYLLRKVGIVKHDGYYLKGLKGIHFEADSDWHEYKPNFAGEFSDVYVLSSQFTDSRTKLDFVYGEKEIQKYLKSNDKFRILDRWDKCMAAIDLYMDNKLV